MAISKKEKSVTGRKSSSDLLVTISQLGKYSEKIYPRQNFPPSLLTSFHTLAAVWLWILDDHKQKP